MPLIKIEDLAAKLKCELNLHFSPRIENPEKDHEYIDNPKPWTARKVETSLRIAGWRLFMFLALSQTVSSLCNCFAP